jgi:hypothetical protein
VAAAVWVVAVAWTVAGWAVVGWVAVAWVVVAWVVVVVWAVSYSGSQRRESLA